MQDRTSTQLYRHHKRIITGSRPRNYHYTVGRTVESEVAPHSASAARDGRNT